MIVKSLSRKSGTKQLVTYILRYILKEQAHTALVQSQKALPGLVIRHNIRSRTWEGVIKAFEENETYRLCKRKDSVKLYHTILSFSHLDKAHITDTLLKDVAKQFIQLRGTNNLYLGTAHHDKEHLHLHLAISGTQLNGRSSRISKQQLQHIKLELDKYQQEKYPQLIHSLPAHGKRKQRTKEEIVQTIKRERLTDKQALLTHLETAFANATSQEQFLSQLQIAGHEPYFRNGKLQGIKMNGERKFRFSGLGFDENKLKILDEKRKEYKSLQELQILRTKPQKQITKKEEQEVVKNNNIPVGKHEEKSLTELREIRNKGKEKRKVDRDDFNALDRGYENNDLSAIAADESTYNDGDTLSIFDTIIKRENVNVQ